MLLPFRSCPCTAHTAQDPLHHLDMGSLYCNSAEREARTSTCQADGVFRIFGSADFDNQAEDRDEGYRPIDLRAASGEAVKLS